MNDDYLFDGSGKPDPEVERLENLLSRFRHNGPAPDFSKLVTERGEPAKRFGWLAAWLRLPRLVGAAAALAVVVFAGWYAIRWMRPAWDVDRVAGTPRVGSRRIRETGRLAVGEALQTDADSRAQIHVGAVGLVEVDPDTRLRLLEARATEHRLALDHGTIHAHIWAPPRLFQVNTPSATAVDLGCQYTLHVDTNGEGLLHVTYGWVAFEQDGHESFVPANAMAITRPGIGPGTPFYEDASPALRAALEKLDFELIVRGVQGGGGSIEAQRAVALDTVLSESRRQDAITAWHLLSRTSGEERARVYDRLAQLVPPPAGVTRDGILAGDAATQHNMRDLWWDALGLGDTSWWRIWKGPVPAR